MMTSLRVQHRNRWKTLAEQAYDSIVDTYDEYSDFDDNEIVPRDVDMYEDDPEDALYYDEEAFETEE